MAFVTTINSHSWKWFLVGFLFCGVLGATVFFSAKDTPINPALIQSPSPYLKSHAEDAVTWQLLSQNTVKKARSQRKPIFISSGYQSCYWCYRMKVDTFSDKKLANIINDSFIPILIDREINLEIDRRMQEISQILNDRGGWPLTMILTPEGHPVIGYNYLDRESFSKAVDNFLQYWQSNPQRIVQLAKEDAQQFQRLTSKQGEVLTEFDHHAILKGLLDQFTTVADSEHGGFGTGEKFPHVPQLDALLTLYSLQPDPSLGNFLQLTLEKILSGSLHDHLAGGFFRYTDNRNWSSPHYEKMLYTQALLGKHLIQAGHQLNRQDFILAGVQTLRTMIREFRGEDGLFIAALSAVSEDSGQIQQGGYYFWTPSELNNLFGNQWRGRIKNLLPENKGRILPFLIGESAEEYRSQLLNVRDQRTRLQDNKNILAWQGLVLSALSHGAALSKEIESAASDLARLLLAHNQESVLTRLIDHPAAPSNTPGLSDYVYLAKGFVDWWQINNDNQYFDSAEKLLVNAYEMFHHSRGWRNGYDYGIFNPRPVGAIVDDQLPSASAMWLSLAWGISGIDPGSKLNQLADSQGSLLPVAVQNDPFFHATLLSTIIARQWQLGKMDSLGQ